MVARRDTPNEMGGYEGIGLEAIAGVQTHSARMISTTLRRVNRLRRALRSRKLSSRAKSCAGARQHPSGEIRHGNFKISARATII